MHTIQKYLPLSIGCVSALFSSSEITSMAGDLAKELIFSPDNCIINDDILYVAMS